MNYSRSSAVSSTLNPKQLYAQYVASLSDQKVILDLQNAVVRYFIPSVDGPVPTAQKRRPLSVEDIEAALDFLEIVSLEALSNAPDLAVRTIEKLGSSTVQKERVRRSLRDLIDWVLAQGYLDPPEIPIPEGICRTIQVGRYAALPLKRASVRQICEEYLAIAAESSENTTDTWNAIIRFFVPGCGGPIPLHKPAREFEVQAALGYLETVPLEYLDEAISITTQVMEALQISQTQQTRIRHMLRELIAWARKWHYLPQPHTVAPWGQPCGPTAPSSSSDSTQAQTLKDYYDRYYQHLESSNQKPALDLWQAAIVRYFVPACGGPNPSGKTVTDTHLQAAIGYLETLIFPYLISAHTLLDLEFERLNLTQTKRDEIRLHLNQWVEWICDQLGIDYLIETATPEPSFNTFRTRGISRPRRKPGAQMQAKRCCDYALGAKKFPNDYINPKLQQQISAYKDWRLANNVNIGGVLVEEEQILQVMGWLHRYQKVPLEDLCFEQFITKSQMTVQAAAYPDYLEYLRQQAIVIQQARAVADKDLEQVKAYLEFVGGHPNSLSRRIFIALAISKFLYREERNKEDFASEQNIPILYRLLKLQSDKKLEAEQSLPTISFSETSVTWEEVIQSMELCRSRADQTITYAIANNTQGFVVHPRPDTALANDVQRLLSIIFCILVPSRSRTFYQLQIGDTFKEGILTNYRFTSVEELKYQGRWEESYQDVRFYFHHKPKDFKTGKSMAPAMRQSEGWWVELPNLQFGSATLYDYIRRWLDWGREVPGEMNHNFFFRCCFSTQPMNAGDWNARIKTIIEKRTGARVPPRNLRKIFATQFADFPESSAVLLQHSESMEDLYYDMRNTVEKIKPVMNANTQFIQDVLANFAPTNHPQFEEIDESNSV